MKSSSSEVFARDTLSAYQRWELASLAGSAPGAGREQAARDAINDATDADLDNQRVGGMVTMTFSNGSQIIVNLQKPLQEVWLAARSGGYHFQFDGERWMDTKGAGDFFTCLSADASAQAGQNLSFTAF